MFSVLINDLVFDLTNNTIIAAEGNGLTHYSMTDYGKLSTLDLGASIEFLGTCGGVLYAVDVGSSSTTIINA